MAAFQFPYGALWQLARFNSNPLAGAALLHGREPEQKRRQPTTALVFHHFHRYLIPRQTAEVQCTLGAAAANLIGARQPALRGTRQSKSGPEAREAQSGRGWSMTP